MTHSRNHHQLDSHCFCLTHEWHERSSQSTELTVLLLLWGLLCAGVWHEDGDGRQMQTVRQAVWAAETFRRPPEP